MRELTLILPYYRNPSMLQEQQRIWATYALRDRRRLHVIVVDDGSPKQQATGAFAPVDGLASYRVYRIGVDIRWNWLACRNLGVDQATTDWVLLTDIDHVVPGESLSQLLTRRLDDQSIYRLARVDAPRPFPYAIADCPVREHKRFHPNTWLMTRAMYDRVGGYDERLSGCYGTDGEFRDRVRACARAVVQWSDVLMVRYGREILADASTVGFTRKNDPDNDADLIRRREIRAQASNWRPARLTFPWTKEREMRIPCSA